MGLILNEEVPEDIKLGCVWVGFKLPFVANVVVGLVCPEYGDTYGALDAIKVEGVVPLFKIDGMVPENVKGFDNEDEGVIVLDGITGLIGCIGLAG